MKCWKRGRIVDQIRMRAQIIKADIGMHLCKLGGRFFLGIGEYPLLCE